MNAKGGKSIEITTQSDKQRMYFDVPHGAAYLYGGRLVGPDHQPIAFDRPMYINLPPAPSAVDSLWKAIWLFLKESW